MRAVEVYNAEEQLTGRDRAIDVMVLRYEDSSELYQNMCTIQQEKLGFVDLIDWKPKLVIDIPEARKDPLLPAQALQNELQKELELSKRDILIVDTREFSCTTPIFLHEKGFWLVPMVITVGDYILSD